MLAEGELTAPALLLLDDAKLADVLKLIAALARTGTAAGQRPARERHVSGHPSPHAETVAANLRGLLAEIAAVDLPAWRREVRAPAALQALEAVGGTCGLRLSR
jgi:histidine ammonia-lyase